MKRLALILTLALVTGLMYIPAVSAYTDTTDLNLIPITDTLEEGTFEWDVQARYNEDFARGRRISTRLFGSLFNNFELGMSWGVSRLAGPVELAAKYKILDSYDGGFPVSLAVGAEGITGNYQTTGLDPTFYGVVGLQDIHLGGWFDLYAGYANNPTGFDTEDNSGFGGFKYWINDDLQINADVLARNSNEDFTAAGGLNYDWVNHMGVQAWVEYDSVTEDNVVVLQFVARADMKDLTAEVSDPE